MKRMPTYSSVTNGRNLLVCHTDQTAKQTSPTLSETYLAIFRRGATFGMYGPWDAVARQYDREAYQRRCG